MLLRFSQAWVKKQYGAQIRELINFVKGSRSCKDLCFKILFLKHRRFSRGHYRSLFVHGFYESEWNNLHDKHFITNIITLKIGKDDWRPKLNEEALIGLIAHEFHHYLFFKQYKRNKGKHLEVRAKKFADKTLLKFQAMRTGSPA